MRDPLPAPRSSPPAAGWAPSAHSQQVLHGNAHQVQLHVGFRRDLLDVPEAIDVGQDLAGEEAGAKRAESAEARGSALKPNNSRVRQHAGMGGLHPQQRFILVLGERVVPRPEHRDKGNVKLCSSPR